MPGPRSGTHFGWFHRLGAPLSGLRNRLGPSSIRVALTVWMGGLGLLPAVAATLVTAAALRHVQQGTEAARLLATAQLVERALQSKAESVARYAEAAAREPALRVALEGRDRRTLQELCVSLAARFHLAGLAAYDAGDRLQVRCGDPPVPRAVPAWRNRVRGGRAFLELLPSHRGGAWLAAAAPVPRAHTSEDFSIAGLLVLYDQVGDGFCAAYGQGQGMHVYIYAPNGVILSRSGPPPPADELQRLAALGGTPTELRMSDRPYLAIGRRLRLSGPTSDIFVGVAQDGGTWGLAALRGGWLVLAMLSGVLLLSLGAGAALARRVSEPVVEIAQAARALATGDLGRRVKVQGDCELRSLAESFNHMAAELEEHTQTLRTKNDELDQHVNQVHRLNELLRAAARTDSLTSVGTHGHVQDYLAKELELANATRRPLSVLMIDVDHFKWINDTYGHPTGDRALKEVAHAISGAVRQNDIVGRHGGDEFCVVLPGATGAEAAVCAERIRTAAVRAEIAEQGRSPLRLTVSLGIATFPDDGTEAAPLVAAADRALYQAKMWRNMALSSLGPSEQLTDLGPDDLSALESGAAQLAAAVAASVDSGASRTAHHSSAVAACAAIISAAMGLPPEGRRALRLAAQVHDIGKVGVPRELLEAKRPLTEEEQRLIQFHAELGGRILRHFSVPEPVPEIVRHHHERYDGHGYPCGLRGTEIPLGSRILAVAEAFVLMTSPREAGAPISAAEALSRLRKESGKALDPSVTAALARTRVGRLPSTAEAANVVGETICA